MSFKEISLKLMTDVIFHTNSSYEFIFEDKARWIF